MSADLLTLPRAHHDPDSCPFGLCDGSGFVVDEQTNTASDCRCRPARIARRRATKLEARIPERYRRSSFERLEGDRLSAFPEQIRMVRRFVARISENIDEGRGVWIMGDVGTGKTELAMLISKAALEADKTVAIYSLPRLLTLIRRSIEHDEGVVGFLDRLSSVDLLHLDDVGAENRTDWALEQLYSIVNTRYEEQRSIVLTTNLDHTQLVDQIGERIVSRLVEMCGDPVPLYGPDRRRELRLPVQSAAQTLQDQSAAQTLQDQSAAQTLQDQSAAQTLQDQSGMQVLADRTDLQTSPEQPGVHAFPRRPA